MIAIQADMIELNGQHILHFSKILDIYVEPEEEIEAAKATEKTWREKANWTLTASKKFYNIISNFTKNISLNYTQSYISIMINGKNTYLFDKRTKPNSIFWFNVKDEEKEQAIRKLLTENNIEFNFNNKYKDLSFIVTESFFDENKDLFQKLHELKYKEYSEEE